MEHIEIPIYILISSILLDLIKSAHNPKVASSNLAPATKNFKGLTEFFVSPFFL